MTRLPIPIMAISFLAMSLYAQESMEVDININGKVTDSEGQALPRATASLEKAKLSVLTDAGGNFSLLFKGVVGISRRLSEQSHTLSVSAGNGYLSIQAPAPSLVAITAYSPQGIVLYKAWKNLDAGAHRFDLPTHPANVHLYRVVSGYGEVNLKGIEMGTRRQGIGVSPGILTTRQVLAKRTRGAAAIADVLTVRKGGYRDFSMSLENVKMNGLAIQLALDQSGSLMLPQAGNPIHILFDRYKEFADQADNILSHQLDCGGWPKNVGYDKPGNGGSDNGTFDNGATTMELTVMADAYQRTRDPKYLAAARKGMEYMLEAQYPEGGWPQFFPLRGGYSDHVTFNDDAMSRVLTVLQHAADRSAPFDADVFAEEQRSRFRNSLAKGVDYILKAQITQNGKKAVWCAQHGKSDYQPKRARAYEHPSLSGLESVGIIGFLMTQPQTPEIKKSVLRALDWYRSPDTYLLTGKEIIEPEGPRVWFRFYDIPTNKPIFSNYDGKIWVGLEYQDKKKGGYRWWGTWGEEIISYADKAGY